MTSGSFNSSAEPCSHGRGSVFPTTHWTNVLAAAQSHDSAGRTALGQLYRSYRQPLYGFLRRQGYPPPDADDLLQGFFEKMLDRDRFSGLTREGGKFRAFLLVAMKRFLAKERDRANAQRRGGGREALSLDAARAEELYHLEPVEPLTPELLFDKRWAETVLDQVHRRLREEYTRNEKAELFDELSEYLGGTQRGTGYAAIAQRHGVSEGVVKTAVHRLRHRFGEMLREEVLRTVGHPDEVEEEIRQLIAAACRSG